ncbi:MAG: hypothetical protein GC179_16500 [Anaerolineaceae bacterium]|nr:hypothetical protein [Anaerolineaceae bacterium]
MTKRLGVIAVVIIVMIGVCGLVIAVGGVKLVSGLLTGTRDLGDSANGFMIALRDEKLDDAYAMLTGDLQQQQSKANFREDFTGNSINDWKFSHFSVKNDVGYIEGVATDKDGNHYVAFQLLNRNSIWTISGYKVGILGWVGIINDASS